MSKTATLQDVETVVHLKKDFTPEGKSVEQQDVETAVHLSRDVTPVGKCLMACVMEAIGMMRNGTMASEEEILKPYRSLFADDPRRLSKAEEVVRNCRVEALQKFPTQTCDMAHLAVFCTLVNTY
ncbi:Odorant binding protein 1 [Gryllus bimaculatus]|nr:Odorant binding protein 1 [Gryllus bimaculatus]